MGSSKKNTSKKQIMKIVPFLSLLTQTSIISASSFSSSPIFKNPKEALEFLRIQRNKDKIPGEFDKIDDWVRLKDVLSHIDIPHDEIEQLEQCTKKCRWNDFGLDFIGEAYEEKLEDWNDDKNPNKGERPWPCPQCCDVLPKTVFGKWDDYIGNSKINTRRSLPGDPQDQSSGLIRMQRNEYKKVAKICKPGLYRELRNEEESKKRLENYVKTEFEPVSEELSE